MLYIVGIAAVEKASSRIEIDEIDAQMPINQTVASLAL
jgi:hypothetical protein